MKGDLAIYILPCGNETHNPPRAAESFEDIKYVVKIETLDHANLWELNGTHYEYKWFGYIYSNEWLDEELAKALPVFLQYDYFDCLILWKRVMDNDTPRAYRMPRIFKNWVRITEGGLLPEDGDDLRFEKALNGWVLESDRKCSNMDTV